MHRGSASSSERSSSKTDDGSSDVDEPHPLLRTEAPKLDAAVEEVVRTEGDYVLALKTLVSGYIPRLSEFLEPDERLAIFGNAQTILGVHLELLERLSSARASKTLRKEVAGVSAAFQAILPFLKLYASYCANYCVALETLERLRSDRPHLNTAIAHAEQAFATHKQGEGDLRLSSCLIRPVKRLCLYPLLLTALLKELDAADARVEKAEAARLAEAGGGASPGPSSSKQPPQPDDPRLPTAAGGRLSRAGSRRNTGFGGAAWLTSRGMASSLAGALTKSGDASKLRRPSEEANLQTAAAARKAARGSLSATSDAVQGMATKVNSMVLEAENRVRMMELHERLRGHYPGLVSPSRRFVRESHVHGEPYARTCPHPRPCPFYPRSYPHCLSRALLSLLSLSSSSSSSLSGAQSRSTIHSSSRRCSWPRRRAFGRAPTTAARGPWATMPPNGSRTLSGC